MLREGRHEDLASDFGRNGHDGVVTIRDRLSSYLCQESIVRYESLRPERIGCQQLCMETINLLLNDGPTALVHESRRGAHY